MARRSSAPSPVRKYSTRGGVSAKDSRPTKPSLWSPFKVSESVLGQIPSKSERMSLNQSLPVPPIAGGRAEKNMLTSAPVDYPPVVSGEREDFLREFIRPMPGHTMSV